MPRDLFSEIGRTMGAVLTRVPADGTEGSNAVQQENEVVVGGLHTFTQTLSVGDVESCVVVEDAAFPPNERATREKFKYRLTVCPQLCLGIFTSSDDSQDPTARTASSVDSTAPERKAILLGHIVSTMGDQPVVTDNDMAYPTSDNADPQLGHKLHGRTVCLHSLAVLPAYQRQKLGSTLMRAYIDRLKHHNVADRLALIAHDYLVPYYEKFGFKSLGPSQAQFGGGGWYDMVLDLQDT